MSTLFNWIGRLVTAVFSAGQAPQDPEAMSLHDWADLPTYHPGQKRTPC
jgi:hypothetical protein